MSDSLSDAREGAARLAYDEGRRAGLAVGALSLSIVAFINLLGMEKSILAAVLALLALHGAGVTAARGRARAALAIAALHVITILTLLALYHEKLIELIRLLLKLS